MVIKSIKHLWQNGTKCELNVAKKLKVLCCSIKKCSSIKGNRPTIIFFSLFYNFSYTMIYEGLLPRLQKRLADIHTITRTWSLTGFVLWLSLFTWRPLSEHDESICMGPSHEKRKVLFHDLWGIMIWLSYCGWTAHPHGSKWQNYLGFTYILWCWKG